MQPLRRRLMWLRANPARDCGSGVPWRTEGGAKRAVRGLRGPRPRRGPLTARW